jgi:hypothetical protein
MNWVDVIQRVLMELEGISVKVEELIGILDGLESEMQIEFSQEDG